MVDYIVQLELFVANHPVPEPNVRTNFLAVGQPCAETEEMQWFGFDSKVAEAMRGGYANLGSDKGQVWNARDSWPTIAFVSTLYLQAKDQGKGEGRGQDRPWWLLVSEARPDPSRQE